MSLPPLSPHRARLRPTKAGGVVALLLGGFTLGALNTGTNLLYLSTALALNLFTLNLLLAWWATRGLRVEREGPDRVEQDQPFEARLIVSDRRGRARAFPVEVRERPPRDGVARRPRVLLLGLGAGERLALGYRATCTQRGWQRWTGVELASQAPFGLVECVRRLPLTQRLLVLPPVYPLQPGALREAPARADAVAKRLVFTAERRDQFRSLREHRPGDDLRAIHWRATARRGVPVVKEFERSAPDATLVVLDLAAAEPDVEDAAVTAAASLHAALASQGQRVGLAAQGADEPVWLGIGGGDQAIQRARELLAPLRGSAGQDLRALAHRVGAVADQARVVAVSTRPEPRAQRAVREAFPGAQVLCLATAADLRRVCRLPEEPA